MPPIPQKEPRSVDKIIISLKLSTKRRATMGGITIAADMSVTPKTCIDTTMVAARMSENRVSIQAVGTP